MKSMSKRLVLASLLVVWANAAGAQTADELVDKSLTAVGGRAALGKLRSRTTTGTITVSTPGGEVSGSIEILNAAPNKSRTLITIDLSSLGAGQLVQDQRFDGKSGYMLDSLQGNREITGNQLDNMRNGSFPSPLLDYKAMGATVRLGDREKVGGRDAYLLILEPTSGSVTRQYIDAETFLPIKVVMKVDVPQLGQEIEQTVEFLDYREVDGVKLAFKLVGSSAVQNFTAIVTKVEHNTKVDEALFSKPPTP